MKIAVCDDDKEFLAEVSTLLERILPGLDNTVTCYHSGVKLLEDCREHMRHYDVLFMDIQMEDMDGIMLGKQLKELDEELILILLTNYVEYAVKGYETRAFRYLLKPVNEEIMRNTLAEVRQELGRNQVLQISVDREKMLLPLSGILFLEAKEKYTAVHVKDQCYLVKKSLNDYEKLLKVQGFCRIHRKYLVNLGNIRKWHDRQLEVGGQQLPISRRKEKEFREQLYNCLERGRQG